LQICRQNIELKKQQNQVDNLILTSLQKVIEVIHEQDQKKYFFGWGDAMEFLFFLAGG
jgi:hypothetical protein